MNSIRPALEALETAFAQLAHRLDLPAGPAPVFTIQAAGRKRALGWFWAATWQNGQPEALPEINLAAEHLARGYEAAMETLVHELAHWANWLAKVKDCNASGYHNRHFKARAEALGLTVEKMGRHGWAYTNLGPELRKTVYGLHVNREAFALARLEKTATKGATRQKLWRCGCTRIRAAVEVHAVCLACGENFILQD